jgi:hypothetical protein
LAIDLSDEDAMILSIPPVSTPARRQASARLRSSLADAGLRPDASAAHAERVLGLPSKGKKPFTTFDSAL